MKKQIRRIGWIAGVGVGVWALGPTAQAAETPPRVSVVSLTLDTARAGAKAGPSIGFGAALSVLALASPPKGAAPEVDAVLQPLIQQLGTEGAGVVADFSHAAQDGTDQVANAAAPLAAINPAVNAGIEGVASTLDAAGAAATAAQPLDRLLPQLAELIRNFEETNT